jgi:zinc protease
VLNMDRGGWRAAIAALVVIVGVSTAGGCSDPRRTLRFGTLIPGDRSVAYAPGAAWFALRNGLRVAVIADASANLVSVDVRYEVGAAEDPPGKTGLAHLVEHLMFEQRADPGGPTLGDRLQAAGLYHNASTSADATHYSNIGLSTSLSALLELEATRLTTGCAGIDPAAFERERAVVLQELAQRDRGDLMSSVLRELYGANHPYARASSDAELAGITLDDVCRFVDAYYAPARAILAVGGPIDPATLRSEIGRWFGPIGRTASGAPAKVTALAPTRGPSVVRAVTDDAIAIVAFPAAAWGSAEAFDEQLIAAIARSRLAQLAERERWIVEVDTGVLGGKRAGMRYFGVSVSDPARLDAAVEAIFKVTDQLSRDDLSDPLAQAAALRMTSLVTGFESITARGAWCADYMQFARDPELHVSELRALQAIDAKRVSDGAAGWIRRASHVVRILPEPAPEHAPRRHLSVGSGPSEHHAWRAAVDPQEADRALPLPAGPPPRPTTQLRLDNGLRVVLAPDFTQPVLEARLVFSVGETGTAAPTGVATAAAELLDHDLVRSYTTKDAWILQWVLSLGARTSASVSDSHTTFAVRGSSLNGGWHVWRLYWLLQNGGYRASALEDARDAVARDARTTRARTTARAWRRTLREAVFGQGHPYAREATPDQLRAALDNDVLEQFRDAHYRASDATLIVVGKFDAAAMRSAITELFGAWPAAPAPRPAPVPAMRPTPGPTWLAHADPDANQLRVTYAFAATSPRVASQAARTVLTEMLDRRVEAVRSELGASYGISADYFDSAAGDMLRVDGRVDAGRGGEALRRVQAAIDGLRAGDDELVADFVRARRAAVARALAAPSESSFTAGRLEAAVAERLALDADHGAAAAIAATTPADIRAVIAADLQPGRTIGILSGRADDVAAAFAAAGITGVRGTDRR